MKALLRKLKKNIVSNWLLLVFVCSGIAVLAVSIKSWMLLRGLIAANQQEVRVRLLATAEKLATLTTAEELNGYREPADAARPEWKELRQKLIKFAKDANVKYVYYLRVIDDKIYYIVDNDIDEENRAGIDKAPIELSKFMDLMPTLLKGEAFVSQLGHYNEDWPGLSYAYAPLFNSDGSVAAVCGVDLEDTEILRMHAIENRLAITIVVVIIVVFVGAWFGFNILQRMVKARTRQVIALQNAVLHGVANIVESRDSATGGHIERTQRYLKTLISGLGKMGLYKEETKGWNIELMVDSSQLHDVGKIAISDSILKKPSSLTTEEFEAMKKHVEFGVSIIEGIEYEDSGTDFLKYAKIFAATHHERWDGSGYPNGLAGSDIPLPGRLMAIADVYDALTSARPYKKAFPPEVAAKIIREGRGSHFDPLLVDVFDQVADQFALIALQPMNQNIA